MKKVILHKVNDPIFGIWGWAIHEIGDHENLIFSTPYYVEIPDDFYLDKTVYDQEMFFRNGCNMGYKLSISRNCEDGIPHLVGGRPVESVKLKVLGPVTEDIR